MVGLIVESCAMTRSAKNTPTSGGNASSDGRRLGRVVRRLQTMYREIWGLARSHDGFNRRDRIPRTGEPANQNQVPANQNQENIAAASTAHKDDVRCTKDDSAAKTPAARRNLMEDFDMAAVESFEAIAVEVKHLEMKNEGDQVATSSTTSSARQNQLLRNFDNALVEGFEAVDAEQRDLKNENRELKMNVELLAGRVTSLEAENESQLSKLENLEEENGVLRMKVESLEEENIALKEENGALRIKVESLEEENKSLGARMSCLEERLDKFVQLKSHMVKMTNLSPEITQTDLNDTFGAYPGFMSAELQNGGCGVIRFSQLDSAAFAAKELNGCCIDDHVMTATVEAVPKAVPKVGLLNRICRKVSSAGK